MTEKQFESIFKLYFTYLSNVAFSIIKDEEDSYDIVQQVFVKLWDKRDVLNVDDNIKSYLHRATVNTSFNFLDKHKRSVKVDDEVFINLPGQQVERNTDYLSGEVEGAIKKAISELPEKCRVVFSLSRYSDLTNKEIAEKLEVSVKAVEKHISRALKELREKLGPYLNYLIIYWGIEVGLNLF